MKSQKEHIATIERFAKKSKGVFTVSDAASVTGLPVLESEWAIRDLMLEYHARLKVSESGDIIYDFGNMTRRAAKTIGQRISDFLGWCYKGFQWFYKAWIAITLVAYFIVFIVILIAAVVAMMAASSKDNDNDRDSSPIDLYVIFRIFMEIFHWKTTTGEVYRAPDDWGYPNRKYEPNKPLLPDDSHKKYSDFKQKKIAKKSFIASVYDFVFGPPRVKFSPLENRKELASYVRSTNGLVTTAEVQALAGWTRAEAEDFLTECLSAYNGKAEVNHNGTLYADFSELNRSFNRKDQAEVVFFWDEYEPEHELTGNTSIRNGWIVFMNVFNLAFASIFLFNLTQLPLIIGDGLAIWLGLGLVPFVFSILFFLIPALRNLSMPTLHKKQRITNIRKRLMKVIFKKHKERISLEELTAVANQWATTEEKLSPKLVDSVVRSFIIDLRGEADVTDEGKIEYVFPDLSRELTDIREARIEKRPDKGLGDVVIDL